MTDNRTDAIVCLVADIHYLYHRAGKVLEGDDADEATSILWKTQAALSSLAAERDALPPRQDRGAAMTDKVSTAPEDVAHMAAELDLSGASSDFAATLRALSAEVERLKVALRKQARVAEMSDEIMLDPSRTGDWKGAGKTADAFTRIARNLRAALGE